MKKSILLLGMLLFTLSALDAQTLRTEDDTKKKAPDKGFSWDRVELGGGLSLGFGTYTFIDISPAIGYRLTDNYLVGIGGTYIYINQKYEYIDYNGNLVKDQFKTNLYGGRIFNQYYITENIFLHAEYEVMSIEYFDNYGDPVARSWVGSPLVGGGYAAPMGGRSRIFITVLYNLNEHQGSPYTNPLFKMGFAVGI